MGSAWWQCAACLRAQEEDVCELQLNHCNLYDVPPDVFIYERTLEKLYLDANRIKDLPRPLFQCHELKVLSLSDNEISTLPPAIASLINLEYLDLSKNNIKELPDSIKECKSLCFIDISVNPFERFPDAITHIVGLCELYINDAYIEYLPANFGRLSALRTLELRENNMMTLPKSMSRLVNLERLDIGNNDFTELPEVVGDLVNLTELWIDGNDIRRIPTSIEQLYRLNHFDCTMNAVHVLPSEIQGWRDISIMNLSSNELYQLPDSLCFLRTIVTLKIDDNQLNSLPNDIGQMSSLEELILTKNFLEYLPPSIGLLRKLHCLNADNNYLRCLPPEIGSCTALSLLSLRSNNLTRVPPELGHLSSLRVLNLVNNYIKFLPVSMLNLTNLKALWLSDNQSQPLVPLQQEFSSEEEMMVLSCFMLPQKPRQDLEQMTHAIGPISSSIIGTGRRICFAADVETELPRQLQRAPTPYPKELRNLARHARNLHHQTVHDQKMQLEKDTIIKEAKIAKSSGSLEIVSKPGICFTRHENSTVLAPSDDRHSSENYTNTTPVGSEVHYTNSEESSDEATKTVLAKEKSPDIREAKYIRNPTSDYMVKVTIGDDNDYVSPPWKPEECTRASAALVVESEKLAEPYRNGLNVMDGTCKERMDGQLPLVPPPYHIAAVFSKKAAFFQQLSPASQLDSHSVLSSAASNSDDVPQETQKHNDKGNSRHTRNNNDQRVDIGTTLKNGRTDSSVRIERLDGPFKSVNDVDRILDNDRSYKPSKIPIFKAKHVDGIHSNSEYPGINVTCSSTDYESSRTINSCDIPTSPITGKKYRSPVSARSKFIDRSKGEPIVASFQNGRDTTPGGGSTGACSPNTNVRTNEQQFPGELEETLANVICGNIVSAESMSNSITDDDIGDTEAKDRKVSGERIAPSPQERKPMFNWMFGPHRNANVLPVRVKKNPGLGFSIAGGIAGSETGIIVTKVNPDGPAQGTLRPGDKILEVDGIDFTKSDHNNAVAVLRATGAVVSMMISRHQ